MFQAVFDILTIGFPFCAFKITTAMHFNQPWLLVMGLIDLFINSVNFFSWLVRKKALLPTCLLAWSFKKLVNSRWFEFGESLDVLFSFIIVAFVIGSGTIVDFPSKLLIPWNIAVVLNVLGAGASRVFSSVGQLKSRT